MFPLHFLPSSLFHPNNLPICFSPDSLPSITIPKYLYSSTIGIPSNLAPISMVGWPIMGIIFNIPDLLGFKAMFDDSHQFLVNKIADLSWLLVSHITRWSSTNARMSFKFQPCPSSNSSRDAAYILNREGEITEPWGTPILGWNDSFPNVSWC